MEYDNVFCFFDFQTEGDEFLIFDGHKDLCFLKKKNKIDFDIEEELRLKKNEFDLIRKYEFA